MTDQSNSKNFSLESAGFLVNLPVDKSPIPQKKPFLPVSFKNKELAKKRVDFVLAYETGNEDEIVQLEVIDENQSSPKNGAADNNDNANTNQKLSTKTKKFAVKELRYNFLNNLNKKGFEIYHTQSQNLKASKENEDVNFILLHLPLEKIEDYATKLQINKPIDPKYVDLVDFLNKNQRAIESMTEEETVKKFGPEIRKISLRKEKSVNFEQPDEVTRGNDLVDDLTGFGDDDDYRESGYKGMMGKLNRNLTSYFGPKHEALQDNPPDFTAVFQKDKDFMFQNYIYKNDEVDEKTGDIIKAGSKNQDFFSASERSKVAAYILSECYFDKLDSGSEAKPTNFSDSYNFGIENLKFKSRCLAFSAHYPLHSCSLKEEHEDVINSSENMRKLLNDEWARYRKLFKFQPMDHIKDYFGEQIALYFSWLGFYNHALIFASLFGVIVTIYGLVTLSNNPIVNDYCDEDSSVSRDNVMCPSCNANNCSVWDINTSCFSVRFSSIFDNNLSMAYAIIMSLWSALFIEFWKRKTFSLNFDWDLTDIDEDGEPSRPRYRAKAQTFDAKQSLRTNPVTMKKEHKVPSAYRTRIQIISLAVTLICILIVIISTFLSIYLRTRWTVELSASVWFQDLQKSVSFVSASLIASSLSSIITVIIILALGYGYDWLARKLTEWEYHRTIIKHENALIHKMFWFNFFNYYVPLFYIAFIKGSLDRYPGNYFMFGEFRWQGCDGGQCIYELAIQLVTIMVVKQLIFGFMEFLFPCIAMYFKKGSIKETDNADKQEGLTRWEQDYILAPTGEMFLFPEYLEMVLQYGFVTLFVTAFPLSPILALINNVIELRLDAKKFIKYHQRSVAHRAANIGAWEHYIALISKISVVSNALIIALTTNSIPRMIYGWNNDSMEGFVQDSISKYNISCFTQENDNVDNLDWTSNDGVNIRDDPGYGECSFYGQRQSSSTKTYDPCAYEFRDNYYVVLVSKLVFIILLEHAVFLAVWFIDWIIPDRSHKLEDQVKREQYITRMITEKIYVMKNLQKDLEDSKFFSRNSSKSSTKLSKGSRSERGGIHNKGATLNSIDE